MLRTLERIPAPDVSFRVITANQCPIPRFRARHEIALAELFSQPEGKIKVRGRAASPLRDEEQRAPVCPSSSLGLEATRRCSGRCNAPYMASRQRRWTERYLAAVERALERPGSWVTVRSDIRSKANASVTARCLAGGYLRVEPREEDREVRVSGHRCVATAAPVETHVVELDEECFEPRVRNL